MTTADSRDGLAAAVTERRSQLPRRLWLPRTIGLGLGAMAVAGALLQRGDAPSWMWVLLLVHALAWPPLAFAAAAKRADARSAEHRNLLIDATLCGFWLPAMGFNLLPSALLVSMMAMNSLAVGGPRLFVRTAALHTLSAAMTAALLPWRAELHTHLATVLSCLPFLLGYPLTVGAANHRLARRLSQQKRALERSAQLHRQTLDALEAGVVLYDAEDRMLMCNADFRNLHKPVAYLLEPGITFEQLLQEVLARDLVPQARGRQAQWLTERLAEHRHPPGPILREMPGDRWRRIVEKRLPDGSLLAFSTDVTELVHAQRTAQHALAQAERSHQRMQDAIDALPDGFALYDSEDRLMMCNQPYRALYRESAAALVPGIRFEELLRFGLAHGQYPQAVGREDAWLAERMERHRHPQGVVLQELPGNRWLRIDERKTREGGLAGVRSEVTDLVRREQQLQRVIAERDTVEQQLRDANERLSLLSDTDALTGLANRRQFDRRLQEEVQRAQRQSVPLSLLAMDVDHFKRFNDRHGHPAGDACLQQVASVLGACARRAGDLVARVGGEEFMVLLPHTTIAEALAVAQRCLQELEDARVEHGDSPIGAFVTLSIGAAELAHDRGALASKELLVAADLALYRAKQQGRHRVATVSSLPALPLVSPPPTPQGPSSVPGAVTPVS